MPRSLLPLLFCLVVTLPLRAVEGSTDARADGWIDREAALAAAAACDRERFPDAELVQVDVALHVRYEEDGTYVQWHEAWVKLLTEQARRRYRTLSSYFTVPYQNAEDCTIPLIEIIKPDGRAVGIDGTGTVQSNPGSMGSNIYNPNSKIRRVNLPGVEVGDVIHYVMYDRIVQPRMRGTWSDFITFEGTAPILHQLVEVDAPGSCPLRSIAIKDPIADSIKATRSAVAGSKRIAYRWEAHDIPRLFPEPQMPPVQMVAQRLLLSTAPDWETISRWYWELSEPHLATDAAMAAKVAELTANATDDTARTEAIFAWVAESIRYMGITTEDTAPGYEPHDVTDTFAQKHGVCRDKAALLVAMLRLAGLEAYPTLIHNGPLKDAEVAQPYFNHAIVAMRTGDGSYRLMDPTDETTRELLPSYLNHKSYLVATPEGETLHTSPIVPAAENLAKIRTEARIDANGDLSAETTVRFEGINDNAYRGFFARRKPADIRNYFAGVIKAAVSGARLTDLTITPADLGDRSQTLTATLHYEASAVSVVGDELILLPVPSLGTRVGMVNFILDSTGLDRREYPLRTDIACGIDERLELAIAPELGTITSLPGFSRIKEDGVAWHPRIERTTDGLTVHGDFRLLDVEYPPAEYQVLKRSLEVIEQDLRKMPIIVRPAGAGAPPAPPAPEVEAPPPARADVRWLRRELAIELSAAGTWTETHRAEQQILTYAGKKHNAELKIGHNRGWEEVEILTGTVIDTDGAVHEIAPAEINTLDAGWVGSASRYPADLITVASLPAVDVGSTVTHSYRLTRRDHPFLWYRVVFGGHDPVDVQTVSLRLPVDHDERLRWLVTDEALIDHDREVDGDTVIHTWTATDLSALPRERATPPAWAYRPTLLLSTGDRAAWAATVHARLQACAADDAGVAEATAGIIAGRDTAVKRIRAVRDYVSTTVRGVGPGLTGMPLTALSAAGTVLTDGYGNNPDRCVLIHALLRHAGFEPRFVLASDLPQHDELYRQAIALPTAAFDHVLVAVTDPDTGSTYHLGDTDQYDALAVCAHADRPALDPVSGAIVRRLDAPRARTTSETVVSLATDGTATVTRSERFHGLEFGSLNKYYTELTPENRRRHHLELLSGLARAAQPVGELVTDFSAHPGERSYTARIPGFAVRDGDHLYCELPDSWQNLLRLGEPRRGQPFHLPDHPPTHRRVIIEAPEGWRFVLLPRQLNGAGPLAGELAITCSEEGGRLLVDYTADLEPTVLKAERYGELLQLQARLRHPDSRMVVLRRENE